MKITLTSISFYLSSARFFFSISHACSAKLAFSSYSFCFSKCFYLISLSFSIILLYLCLSSCSLAFWSLSYLCFVTLRFSCSAYIRCFLSFSLFLAISYRFFSALLSSFFLASMLAALFSSCSFLKAIDFSNLFLFSSYWANFWLNLYSASRGPAPREPIEMSD